MNPSTPQDTAIDIVPACTDVDLDPLTFSLVTGASNGIASAGLTTLHYAPAGGYVGPDSFTFRAMDATTFSNTVTVNMTVTPVNHAPDISEGPGPLTVSMSEDGVPNAFNLTLNATDPDVGNTLTWSISTPAVHGTASASGTGSPKTITFTPAANYNGSDSFVVQVSDGSLTDSITVNVTLSAQNDAPVNVIPGTQTTLEDTTLVFSSATGRQISVSDADVADTIGGQLEVAISAGHGTVTLFSTASITITGGANGSPSVLFRGLPANINAAMNGLVYTPAENFVGADTLTITTDDAGRTGNGGPQSDTDAVTINVTTVNDLPVITEGASISRTISEDGSPTAFSLTLHATDVEGDTLTWSLAAPAATHGGATASGIGASQVISYTPSANFNGLDSFGVQVSDGNGGVDTILVNVTIDAYNDAPVNVVPGGQTTSEDTAIVFSGAKLISVSDPDVAETGGGQLQVTLSALHGVLKLSTTSSLTVTGDNTALVTLTGFR